MLSQETIQLAKTLDFPSYLKSSGLQLIPVNGGSAYKALCPFHADKNPSFSVTLKDKGWLWHCFGCDAGGDAIEFVKKREGLNFREAVIKLSPAISRIPASLPIQKQEISLSERKRLLTALTEFYHQILLDGVQRKNQETTCVKSRYYLQKRGLLDEQLIKTFKIGISDGNLNKALQKGEVPGLKFEERSILYSQLGIFKNNYVEACSSALIFPVIDTEGKTTEIYARRILHYLDRTNHCYTKGEHVGVWNFINVKDSDTIILTEGIIDALSIYKAGFPNVTALYGASGYTKAHEVLFKNGKVKRLIFALDNDKVGQGAVQSLSEKLPHLQLLTVLFPEKYKDANGVLVSEGVEALRELVFKALPIENREGGREKEEEGERRGELGEGGKGGKGGEIGEGEIGETFVNKSFSKPLQKTLKGSLPVLGTASDQKKLTAEKVLGGENSQLPVEPVPYCDTRASDLIFHGDKFCYELRNAYALRNLNGLKLVVKVRLHAKDTESVSDYMDRLDFYAARSRKLFMAALAERFSVQENSIENDLHKITEIIERHYKNKEAPQEKSVIPVMSEAERVEALTFLKSEGLLFLIIRDLTLLGYIGDDTNKLLLYLAATSRKLPKPLSVLIRSQSSTGKSYLIDLICSVMPAEDVIKLTSMTPKALYYVEADALKHKFLAIDERAGMEEAEYSIRSLQSGGKLTMAVPNKNPLTGKIETTQIEREGPIAYVDGSTDTRVNPENANRCFEIFLDESPEQTARIQNEQKKAHGLEGLQNKIVRDAIRRKHQNVQRLLRSVFVVIPYAHRIDFPADWLRTRRDHDRFLNLIVVIAFLHQYQREQKPFHSAGSLPSTASVYIEATEEDYGSAYKLAREILWNTFAELDVATAEFYTQLQSIIENLAKEQNVPLKECTFTRWQIREKVKIQDHVLKGHLRILRDLEYVSAKMGGRGSTYIYTLSRPKTPQTELVGLTTPEELKSKL
jgi:DNA primase catalytic core